ncbi:MAG: glutamate--tRNA ligase [Syntrophorhabdales bacterium]|jgi:glutamyl-tRNA synthetase
MTMVRARFAPSPTGNLHIGGARTALFNWLFARHHNGSFILRIEDTDRERSKDVYTKDILDGLSWLGITHDGPLTFQSARFDLYKENAYRLLDEGHAYRCYCTPEVLEEKRKTAMAGGRKPSYDRTCRECVKEYPGKPNVIRFKTPLTGTISFDDMVRGRISFQAEELDDLIIYRSDDTPTYNFTVVVDDALMGVTHVLRGDDHINNTPRQVLLYRALGFEVPQFGHMPLIHGKDKARLSKRHGAASLLEYREGGFLAEALMNYLARLGWAHGDQEVFSAAELVEKFDIKNVGKSPAIFDMDKLMWLNSHYIKTIPAAEIARRFVPFVEKLGYPAGDEAGLLKIVVLFKERAKTLKEMAQMAAFFWSEGVEYEPKAASKYLTSAARPILERFLEDFSRLETLKEEDQRAFVEAIAKTFDKKLVEVIQPVRVALSGKEVTPGIFEVIEILGREKVEKRIAKAIASIT